MNARPDLAKMMEATRLTREGRLQDALAMIQGALGLQETNAVPSDRLTEPEVRSAPRTIDMAPPSKATGNAWALPRLEDARSSGKLKRTSDTTGVHARLLDRLGRGGFEFGSSGVAGHDRVSVPDGARFEERLFANEAGSRTYKLYIPSGYSGQPIPLVVMLHGCTQSPDDFAVGTGMNKLAEEQNFIVAYPAQARSANSSKCWNWFKLADQVRDRGEPAVIAGLTRAIMQDCSVDPTRVYIAGLSAGGAMAAVLGAAYPELYAAVGVHSGLACGAASDMPSALTAMRSGAPPDGRKPAGVIPTIVFHGDRDTTVHPLNGEQVIARSALAGNLRPLAAEGRSVGGLAFRRTVHTDDGGQPVLEHWSLRGAGHAWSGGSAAGSYTEPRGPDASREMMRFFLQQQAPGLKIL